MFNFFRIFAKIYEKKRYHLKLTLLILILLGSYCYGQTAVEQSQKAELACYDVDSPGWGSSLGVVSFVSNKTWTISENGISQIWSDAVQADSCSAKTSFYGGDRVTEIFKIDCRSNPNGEGDFFSWCAVVKYGDILCPSPWRVPTRWDFVDLYNALGGIHSTNSRFIYDWGGSAYSGGSNSRGVLYGHGTWVSYWSQTEGDSTGGRGLYFNSKGLVNPHYWNSKRFGFLLRCVRDD